MVAEAKEPPPVSIIAEDETSTEEGFSAKEHYGLKTLNTKLVDNNGQGFENLYGTRNFRTVIANVMYRGGGNNTKNRDGTRPNQNPLPANGLKSLCEEGFDTAIYMYSAGYESAPPKVSCISRKTGKQNTLDYLQMSPYQEPKVREMLEMVSKKIKAARSKAPFTPAYIHCWNGWHASGLISAYMLRQFCNYSGSQAVKYWDLNTDGNDREPAFEKLRKQIRDFKPYEDLKLTSKERSAFCLPSK